ncbi:hypothetical protein [Inquilinus sp.]|uniref:hypothetical protein n=1 Tax=Inquilinus sp. TaxID=1932117 RepID=UPI00378349E9
MANDLTSNIDSFSKQWHSFCISILFSDFPLYLRAAAFGLMEMPKLEALPGEMRDFVSRESPLIARAEQTHSTSDLEIIIKDIQGFCNEKKPELTNCVAQLSSLRQRLTDGVSDVDSERAALQLEWEELMREWDDAGRYCQGWLDTTNCRIAYMGEGKYQEMLKVAFTLSLLNFTVECVDGLVRDIVPLTAAFDMLLDKVKEMLEDIDEGFADLPDIKIFLSELH